MKTSAAATSVLFELEAAGVAVSTNGVDITLVAEPSILSPALRARVRAQKPRIVALLLERNAARVPSDNASDIKVPHDPRAEHRDLSPKRTSSEDFSTRGSCGSCGSCGTGAAGDEVSPSSPTTDGTATPISVDFEARAPVALESVGGRAYALHPGMEVLCAALILPDRTVIDWVPGDAAPREAFELVARGVPVIAHNAHGFDKFVWQRLGWPEATWIDSLPLARLSGLPGKLGELAAAVLDIKKDEVGKEVTLAVGRLDRHGRLSIVTPAQLAVIRNYCRIDTLIVRRAWEKTLFRAVSIEPEVRAVDVIVNERGFPFDTELAHAIIRCEAQLATEARADARVDANVLASPSKLRSLLAQSGTSVDNVRRETLLELLDDPDLADDVRAVVSARVASSGIASHKLRAGLRLVSGDGRLRDTLSYHQALTGRWAGRGFQPQNLARGAHFEAERDLQRAVGAVLRGEFSIVQGIAAELGATAQDVCGSLVRACIVAPPGCVLGTVDYAQVEARALLWLADDARALEQFRAGIDPYSNMAATLFGILIEAVTRTQRSLGKPLVLGAGYGMGAARFESYASTFRVDWAAVGVTPAQAVEGWRSAHPAVAGYPVAVVNGVVIRRDGLWQRLQEAAERAARGARSAVGPLVWERRDRDVVCILPSGRPFVYRNVRLELRPTPWGKKRWTFTYEHRGQRVPTYGAKLSENVTQAICRDILADALVRLDRAGKRIVLHVHDEIVAELDDASEIAEMETLMCKPPRWAAGLPLQATGHTGARYRK